MMCDYCEYSIGYGEAYYDFDDEIICEDCIDEFLDNADNHNGFYTINGERVARADLEDYLDDHRCVFH